MRDRNDEYWALVGELAQPPQRLEGSLDRARRRARRHRLLQALATPAATLAACAACFVLMVNAFPTFALACSEVPVLRELAAAAAFSPSLSAALAHDYVQYIGQAQTRDGVTVRLEYAITDQAQTVFFYSVEGGRFFTGPRLTGPDGAPISGFATSRGGSSDDLESMVLSFSGERALPERFTMEMSFLPEPAPEQTAVPAPTAPPDAQGGAASEDWADPREDPRLVRFTFEVALDSSRIAQPILVPVDRWVELDGQRIQVDRLELLPTRTIVHLAEDPANTAWLRSLKFHFEDGAGARYEELDGSLSAMGAQGSKSYLTYYFQSFYYHRPQGLTLCLDRAEWLDKGQGRVCLDLTTGSCPGLPDGVRVDEIVREGGSVRIKVLAPLEHKGFGSVFGGSYWDPEGGEHSFTRWGGGSDQDEDGEEAGIYEMLYLDDWSWDTVELELSCTSISAHRPPLRVPLD